MHRDTVFGIFVGGKSTRMGGFAKGLLPAPDGPTHTLVERLLGVVNSAAPEASVCLIGAANSYAALGLPVLVDQPSGVGPIGGLNALLVHAAEHGQTQVVALACDLPYVSTRLLQQLLAPTPAPSALAPHLEQRWQPFFARYQVEPVRQVVSKLLAGRHSSLQLVFHELGAAAHALPLDGSAAAELQDWDSPEDIKRSDMKAGPRQR